MIVQSCNDHHFEKVGAINSDNRIYLSNSSVTTQNNCFFTVVSLNEQMKPVEIIERLSREKTIQFLDSDQLQIISKRTKHKEKDKNIFQDLEPVSTKDGNLERYLGGLSETRFLDIPSPESPEGPKRFGAFIFELVKRRGFPRQSSRNARQF